MEFPGSGVEHSNPNGPFETENVIGGGGDGGDGGGVAVASAMQVEVPQRNVNEGVSVAVAAPVTPGESGKRKRGRPRKYGLDGSLLSMALSPLSVSASSGAAPSSVARSTRGRPPGTGWRQQWNPLGEWMPSPAGSAVIPHFIIVDPAEDVTARIQAFAVHRSRALCVLSATGSVSSARVRQPLGSVTYEGCFNIITLQGSYVLDKDRGPRTGGISISMSTPDGHIIGGAIAGRVIAESQVKVMAFSFTPIRKPNNINVATDNGGEKSPTAPNSPTQDLPSMKVEMDVKEECSCFDA